MAAPGEIISYTEMCSIEGASLQRGMNFRLKPTHSVVLLSRQANAPYNDRVEDDGRALIYEGHDHPRTEGVPNPKLIDQPLETPSGKPTQNGLFHYAAERAKGGEAPEAVRCYEKLRSGIWTYAGLFHLVDAWRESDGNRQVSKFRLVVSDEDALGHVTEIDHSRVIPSLVKQEVWKRDGGRCVACGSSDNLHFDHIIPYSKGGSSLVVENIQILCARHNLSKHDKIE